MRDGIISVLFGFEWQYFSRINSGVPYAPVVSLSRWGSKYSIKQGFLKKRRRYFQRIMVDFLKKLRTILSKNIFNITKLFYFWLLYRYMNYFYPKNLKRNRKKQSK